MDREVFLNVLLNYSDEELDYYRRQLFNEKPVSLKEFKDDVCVLYDNYYDDEESYKLNLRFGSKTGTFTHYMSYLANINKEDYLTDFMLNYDPFDNSGSFTDKDLLDLYENYINDYYDFIDKAKLNVTMVEEPINKSIFSLPKGVTQKLPNGVDGNDFWYVCNLGFNNDGLIKLYISSNDCSFDGKGNVIMNLDYDKNYLITNNYDVDYIKGEALRNYSFDNPRIPGMDIIPLDFLNEDINAFPLYKPDSEIWMTPLAYSDNGCYFEPIKPDIYIGEENSRILDESMLNKGDVISLVEEEKGIFDELDKSSEKFTSTMEDYGKSVLDEYNKLLNKYNAHPEDDIQNEQYAEMAY